MSTSLPTLDRVLADPGCVAGLSPENLAQLLVQVAAVQSAISARLVSAAAAENGNGVAPGEPDETMDVRAIAKRLNKSCRWVWRSKHKLPLRRVGRGLIASRHELDKWLMAQKIK